MNNMFEDKVEKSTIIINGKDTDSLSLDLADNIKNVIGIKHVKTYATIDNINSQSHPNFQNVFIKINDFNLKSAYVEGNVIPCYGHLIFQGNNPSASFISTKSYSTGIITDFDTDTDNYVLNPVLPQLNKLNVSFIKEDGSSIVMKEFTIELTIYSRFIKQTMF